MASAAAILAGIGAAGLSANLIKKYGPSVGSGVRGLANLALHNSSRKSALAYSKKLGTKQGAKHFLTQDAVRGAKATLDIVAQGGKIAGQVKKASGGEGGGGGGGEGNQKIPPTHSHEVFEKYNEKIAPISTQNWY